MNDDDIILYIVFRQSLNFDNNKSAYYAANAVQYILLKYFALHLLAVKTHLDHLANDPHIKTTVNWLSSKSKKAIVNVDEHMWEKLKQEHHIGRNIFVLKDIEPMANDVETTLVFWPTKYSELPKDLK